MRTAATTSNKQAETRRQARRHARSMTRERCEAAGVPHKQVDFLPRCTKTRKHTALGSSHAHKNSSHPLTRSSYTQHTTYIQTHTTTSNYLSNTPARLFACTTPSALSAVVKRYDCASPNDTTLARTTSPGRKQSYITTCDSSSNNNRNTGSRGRLGTGA